MKNISKPVFIVLAIAFAFRICWMLLVYFKNPDGIWAFDSYGYWYLGKNLSEHGVFSQHMNPPFYPDYFRTPLYPLFLALFQILNADNFILILVQVILSVLTCYFTFRISKEILQNERAGLIAALIMALDVPSIVLSDFVLTETLFSFLFIISCFLFLRFMKEKKLSSLVFSGIIFGLCMLCRPIVAFLPLLFLFFIAFIHRKEIVKAIQHSAIFGMALLLVISPWVLRNKNVFGEFSLTYLGTHTLLNHHAASIEAEVRGKSYSSFISEYRQEVINKFQGDLTEKRRDALKQPAEFAAFIRNESFRTIRENFEIFLKIQIKNVFEFFVKPVRGYIDLQLKNLPAYSGKNISLLAKIIVVIQLLFLALIYIGFIWGIFSMKKEFIFLIFILLLIIYFSNMTVPPFSEARYRIPVMPLIAIVSAIGIDSTRKAIGKHLPLSQQK